MHAIYDELIRLLRLEGFTFVKQENVSKNTSNDLLCLEKTEMEMISPFNANETWKVWVGILGSKNKEEKTVFVRAPHVTNSLMGIKSQEAVIKFMRLASPYWETNALFRGELVD